MKTTRDPHSERPTALITGGSKGIGLMLARQFAQHNHDLVLVARDDTQLSRAAQDLEGAYPGCTVTTIPLDLSDEQAPTELLRRLQAMGGHIDVLVNNAGVGDYGPLFEADSARLAHMIKLNVLSPTLLTRLFLPDMIERGRGRILNVASVVAFYGGGPNWTSYVASKHYVLAFTRGLRGELSGTGVTVTALCPGPAATDFASRSPVGGARAYRWLPKVAPANIARSAYRATMAGRAVIVPGLFNKILAFLGELPPRAVAQAVFTFLLKGNRAPRRIAGRVS